MRGLEGGKRLVDLAGLEQLLAVSQLFIDRFPLRRRGIGQRDACSSARPNEGERRRQRESEQCA
jgi:hypothetical protein